MKYEVTPGGGLREVEVSRERDGRYRVVVDGKVHLVDLSRPTPEAFQMLIDGASWEAGAVARDGEWLVEVMGLTTAVQVVDPRRKALRVSAGAAGGTVNTQMPGRVVRLLVAVGDAVQKGQPLLVVEAMKMENELRAPVAGTVAEVFVAEGQAVESGARLVRID
jgi:biotin carboxyl carrier protein